MSAVFARRRARTSAERAERGHELRAVDEREALLRLQAHRLEPDRRERLAARAAGAVDRRLALADQRQREVRERREIAARADRAAARHARQDAAVEALDQQLDGLDARARVALRERVRAQQHRGAHDLVRVRLADAAGVAAEEAQLELLGQLLRDRARDEAAEAGVDAVRVLLAPVRRLLDELARRAPSARAPRRQARPARPVDGDRPDVGESEIVAGQRLLSITRRVYPCACRATRAGERP